MTEAPQAGKANLHRQAAITHMGQRNARTCLLSVPATTIRVNGSVVARLVAAQAGER